MSVRLAAYFPSIVCSAKHGDGRKSGWRIVGSLTCFVSVSYSCIQFYINRAPRVAIGRSRHLLGCSKILIVFLSKKELIKRHPHTLFFASDTGDPICISKYYVYMTLNIRRFSSKPTKEAMRCEVMVTHPVRLCCEGVAASA